MFINHIDNKRFKIKLICSILLIKNIKNLMLAETYREEKRQNLLFLNMDILQISIDGKFLTT